MKHYINTGLIDCIRWSFNAIS